MCPCHALLGLFAGAASLLGIALPALTPSEQDGLHALYLPLAVLSGAILLAPNKRRR